MNLTLSIKREIDLISFLSCHERYVQLTYEYMAELNLPSIPLPNNDFLFLAKLEKLKEIPNTTGPTASKT